MTQSLNIVQIDNALLWQLWPFIGSYLVAGAQEADEGTIKDALDDVANHRARVWAVIDGDEVLAAFLTSVVTSDDGAALDVYGLGGRSILRWGKALTNRMNTYAKINGCSRVIFKGRKALMRAYEGLHVIGEEKPGLYSYERAVQ